MSHGHAAGPGAEDCQISQFLRALLHAITFAIAYIVMLLAMYFNGYILVSIFLGAGLGKFLTDWLVVQVVVDNGGRIDTLADLAVHVVDGNRTCIARFKCGVIAVDTQRRDCQSSKLTSIF
uniref:Copper transport protein n=1 Tax=Pyricularia oryzae (strain P131) TaxID=1143193 RepID=L7IY40_PYRO1